MKHEWFFLVAILAVSLCIGSEAADVPRYFFSSAGKYPGAALTYPNVVNLTQIVGYYWPPVTSSQGYIQVGSHFITAAPQGSYNSYLFSVNAVGVAAGGYCSGATGCDGDLFAAHGYTYNSQSGATTTIDYPGAGTTVAFGINDAGVVVGGYCVKSREGCPLDLFLGSSHAFMDDNGVFTQLDFPGADETTAFAINNAGMIVGTYEQGLSIVHAFIYENATYTDINFPGANWSEGQGVNDLGVVVGYYQDANFNVNGFMYYEGEWTKINVLPGNTTAIVGINSHDDLVGTWTDNTGQSATFKAIPVAFGTPPIK